MTRATPKKATTKRSGAKKGDARPAPSAAVASAPGLAHMDGGTIESERLCSVILENVREGIAVHDHELRFVAMNAFLEQTLGVPRSALLGKRLLDVAPQLAGSPVEQALRKALAGEPSTLPDAPYSYEGRTVWLSNEYVPLRTRSGEILGVVATAHDVSMRVAAMSALRESERRFRQLAESIREVFWMTDVDKTRVLYVSPAYERVWGRSCESLVRTPSEWLEGVHPDDRPELLTALATKQRAGTFDEQYRVVRPDGATRWVRDRAFPVYDGDGELVAFAGLAEDITEQREIEAQLRQAQRLESTAQLAGGVAHDFNNLLTVISSNCEFLLDALEDDPDSANLVHEIRGAGVRAAVLTQQLLAFSRRQLLEPKAVDLNQAIREVTKMLGRLVGKDVTLASELDPSVRRARVDPGHLTQLVINLALHARDAMPGGGRLTLRTRNAGPDDERVLARLDRRVAGHGFVVLSMIDTGMPLPEEEGARVFEPFSAKRTGGRSGGLGMSAVHGVATQSGGTVEVRPEPGGGTRFDVFLPAAQGDVPAVEVEPARAPARRPTGLGTVLLVEDDAPVRRAARRMLEDEGFVVLVASDGKHALDVYRELGGPVDLVLTDVVMPEIGGTGLAREIKLRQPNVPILFTSGYTDDPEVQRMIDAGEGFLQKPYSRAELLGKVRASLRRA